MLLIDSLEHRQQLSFCFLIGLRGYDDVSPIGSDFKRSIHSDLKQVHECFVNDQGSAVSVLNEFLCHKSNVYTWCIRSQGQPMAGHPLCYQVGPTGLGMRAPEFKDGIT
jgi:hypothetical protein